MGRRGARARALFENTAASLAKPIALAEWRDRPIGERIREFYSSVVADML